MKAYLSVQHEAKQANLYAPRNEQKNFFNEAANREYYKPYKCQLTRLDLIDDWLKEVSNIESWRIF